MPSCQKNVNRLKTIYGKEDVVSEIHLLESFTKIESNIAADINIYESEEYILEISAQENLLSYFEADTKKDVLIISFGDYNIRTKKSITINIYTPVNKKFTLNGAGKVYSEMPVEHFLLNGAGNFRCLGEVDNLTIELNGSGNFSMFDLKAQQVKINIAGSCNVEVTAEKELDVTIAGVGNVYYKGDPLISQRISGVGNIVDKN